MEDPPEDRCQQHENRTGGEDPGLLIFCNKLAFIGFPAAHLAVLLGGGAPGCAVAGMAAVLIGCGLIFTVRAGFLPSATGLWAFRLQILDTDQHETLPYAPEHWIMESRALGLLEDTALDSKASAGLVGDTAVGSRPLAGFLVGSLVYGEISCTPLHLTFWMTTINQSYKLCVLY